MGKDACDNMLECNHLPDACTNELHEEGLMQRQRKGDDRSYFQRVLERDRNLIIACVVLVVAMNFETGRYLLFPFKIYSTWVHEMCHGLAACLTPGGYIGRLYIYKNGGGLAYTSVKSLFASSFVSSAGYPGTAVTGFLMLIFRRTTLGPTIGTIFMGCALLLSVALWVRNAFGMWFLSLEGVVLLLFAWKLPAVALDNLFNFLAVTCCLNAVENVQDLFGFDEGTDAHSVAKRWPGDYRVWATIWLWFSIAMTALGILFSFDARALPACARDTTDSSATYTADNSVAFFGGNKTSNGDEYKRFGTPAQVV